ncbi:uncharacterized protein LOC129597874 [Paramacrobiotus metropolitanus]|uniref:uncharacterized protein LOC129597874 n=1 Tax=Paramacrobiotus metropolitanus TaxID=2943436 RepID=UPI0024463503|nr:uncharacterized protein LOC129597874 [Paramacrobiotus metropolitanus]
MVKMALSTVWYGGVQIILGLIIAVPSMTIQSLSTTIALCVSLLLTGIYALLGSSYINSTRQLLEASRRTQPENVQLPTEERLVKIHGQFLKVYAAACGVLIVLSIASGIHGTVYYFGEFGGGVTPSTQFDHGSTAAIAGVASIVINIFIAGSCIADYKRLRAHGYERPRSPTPSSGHTDPRMDIATIPVDPAIAFPPPYSQIHLDPKGDDYELPPSYLESTSASTSTNSLPVTSELALAVPFCMGEPVPYVDVPLERTITPFTFIGVENVGQGETLPPVPYGVPVEWSPTDAAVTVQNSTEPETAVPAVPVETTGRSSPDNCITVNENDDMPAQSRPVESHFDSQ